MTKIKKYLIAICVLAAALYGGAGVALATTGPAPSAGVHTVTNNPCPGAAWHWAEGSGDHMWRVYWTSNPNRECWLQGAFRCHNRNGAEHWFHGGRVTSVGLESGVNCDSQYPEPDQGNVNYQAWPLVNPYYYKCQWSC